MERKSFSEVEEIVRSGHLEKLGRSSEGQAKYSVYKDLVLQEWKTVGDLVLASRFQLHYDMTNDGKKYVPLPNPSKPISNLILLENEYPYNFEEGIIHFILWKLDDEVSEDDITQASEDIRSKHQVENMVHYINPPQLKSVLNVHHAHIVVKYVLSF